MYTPTLKNNLKYGKPSNTMGKQRKEKVLFKPFHHSTVCLAGFQVHHVPALIYAYHNILLENPE